MSRSHKKKRNTGLLYEFLVGAISQSLVEGDQKASARALKILKRHFKPGTELYNEFRLIRSLIKTTVSSEAVAASIIQEAKTAARSRDLVELDKQKSFLIKGINHFINNENFYDQQVNEYRMYATIQTLLNDWRTPNSDLERMAHYEDQLITHLTTPKKEAVDHVISEDTSGSSRLLMKVMMKKLNEKYTSLLNAEQKSLIRAYAFSTANDDPNSIKKKLLEVKEHLIECIDNFNNERVENEYINKKLIETKHQLVSETLEVIDDDTVTRFMLYTKLEAELRSEENDNV